MYHVSAQGVDEHMINVHYYYYYYNNLTFVSDHVLGFFIKVEMGWYQVQKTLEIDIVCIIHHCASVAVAEAKHCYLSILDMYCSWLGG